MHVKIWPEDDKIYCYRNKSRRAQVKNKGFKHQFHLSLSLSNCCAANVTPNMYNQNPNKSYRELGIQISDLPMTVLNSNYYHQCI